MALVERKKLLNRIFDGYAEITKVRGFTFYARTFYKNDDEYIEKAVCDFLYYWIVSAMKGSFEEAKKKRQEVVEFWEREYKRDPKIYVDNFSLKIKECKRMLEEVRI